MKNSLMLEGLPSDFFEPYYIYDIVSINDKSMMFPVPRRRASAISYSEHGEIIIATAICSEKDIFVKKQARNILNNRLSNMVRAVVDGKIDRNIASFGDANFFASLEVYNDYCNIFDETTKLLFAPYRIKYLHKEVGPSWVDTKGRTRRRIDSSMETYDVMRGKGYNETYMTLSDIYWHRQFVNTSYNKFMACLNIESTVETSLQEASSPEDVIAEIVHGTSQDDTD